MTVVAKLIELPTRSQEVSQAAVSDRPVGDALRLAMRELASGVCIITTGAAKARCGLTATSVTSLSLTPPSVLVCVDKRSRSLAEIVANGVFAVNTLSGSHRRIAEDFANRGARQGVARFDGADWTQGKFGAPVLTTALAALECHVGNIVDWHSHLVVFGLVQHVHLSGRSSALTYWRGDYCQSQSPDPDGTAA